MNPEIVDVAFPASRTWFGALRCRAGLSVPIRVGLLDRPTGERMTYQCSRRMTHDGFHRTAIMGKDAPVTEQWCWDDEAAQDIRRCVVWAHG